MNRLLIPLCLCVSFMALGLAGFALLESRSGGARSPEAQLEELHELTTLVGSLEETVAEQKAVITLLQRRAIEKRVVRDDTPTSPPAETVSAGDRVEEQVAALTERLASLENEETIARLAQSGRTHVAEKEIRSSLDQVVDPDAAPGTRLEAWKSVRRLWGTDRSLVEEITKEHEIEERDLVLPMVDLAQDTTLEPEFRADVVRNLHGSRAEELRQPLLDLVANDDVSEVRVEALTALMWHLDDATIRERSLGSVRETATRTSRRERNGFFRRSRTSPKR